MKIKRNKKLQPGAIYILSVLSVVILSMLGIGLLRLAQGARLQAVKDVLQISARSAADAGIEHAVRHMIDIWNAAENKDVWVEEWDGSADEAAKFSFPANLANMVILDKHNYGDAGFRYEIYKGTRPQGYQIISTGTARGVTRKVHAAVMLKSSLFGIGAKETIKMQPNFRITVLPEDGKIIIQTNSIETGTGGVHAMGLKQGLEIPGDLIVGPGGDPYAAINNLGDVTLTNGGQALAAEETIEFPSINPPTGLPVYVNLNVFWVNGEDYYIIPSSLEIIGGLTSSDTIYIGDPTVHGGGTIIKVYSAGSTNLNSQSKLIVSEGYRLEFYMGGNIFVNGAAITYTEIPPVGVEQIETAARAITFKGTPDCVDVKFNPLGDFYGTIYAPDASILIQPNGDFHGAIIGGESITFQPQGSDKGHFVYLPGLLDLPDDIEVFYMGVKRGSWWEEVSIPN